MAGVAELSGSAGVAELSGAAGVAELSGAAGLQLSGAAEVSRISLEDLGASCLAELSWIP